MDRNHRRGELPNGAIKIPTVEMKMGNFIPQTVDAKIELYGITWYRVAGGFGGRGDREDWIADVHEVSICACDYQWNGESFGPDFGTFDNACLEALKSGLKYATGRGWDRWVETSKIAYKKAIDRLVEAVEQSRYRLKG